MPNYSREVSERVSNNRKTLEGSVAISPSEKKNYSENTDANVGFYRRGISKIKAGVLGLCALALVGGCTPTQKGQNILDSLAYTAVDTLIREEITKKVWEPKQNTEDLPVNYMVQNQDQPQIYQGPEFFTCNQWVDLNNNGISEKNEYFGLEKKVFDLDKERLTVAFWNKNYKGRVIFRSWTDTGELIGKTEYLFEYPYNSKEYFAGPEKEIPKTKFQNYKGEAIEKPSGDFMDKLKQAGPGNYRITTNTDDRTTYSLDVEIVGGGLVKTANE